MEFRIVSLDKSPGFWPVSIRDIIRRLLSKSVLLLTCAMEKDAWSNLNLFYVLGSGIEGAVHTTLSYYIKTWWPLAADQALLSGGADRYKGLRSHGQEELVEVIWM